MTDNSILVQAAAHASDPLLLITPQLKVVWSNSAAAKLLGERPLPWSLSAVMAPEKAVQLARNNSFAALECEIRLGNESSQKLTACALDVSGFDSQDQFILIVLKAASANKLGINQREEFLSTVAHDLKNPLGAIFGFADTLLDSSSSSPLDARARQILNRIRGTALRCVDLVRNYQLLSLISSGVISRPALPVDFNQVIQTCIDASWRESSSAHSLVVELSAAPLPISAEKVLLDRVFSNLFSNALRYTPESGKITVRTEQVGAAAVLSVANNLPIIPAPELEKIFARHVRTTAAGEKSGSGLGLYIVFQITQLLAGEVSVKSAPDTGTVFTVKLPLGVAAQDTRPFRD